MTREHRALVARAEYDQLREFAQEVGCPACNAVIGSPCTGRLNQELAIEHHQRINKAKDVRERGVPECTSCHFERLTEQQRAATPWPEQQVACGRHRELYEEIREAMEMVEWYEAYDEARAKDVGHADAVKIASERVGLSAEEGR